MLFRSNAPAVTLVGRGWIDVRDIRQDGSNSLAVTWIDDKQWTASIPLNPGTNKIVLQAFDHRGLPVGQDSISVVSTVSERPQRDYLRVAEIMYHPPVASATSR